MDDIQKLADQQMEAYCVMNLLPVTRRYSDAELAPHIAALRAAEQQVFAGMPHGGCDPDPEQLAAHERADRLDAAGRDRSGQ